MVCSAGPTSGNPRVLSSPGSVCQLSSPAEYEILQQCSYYAPTAELHHCSTPLLHHCCTTAQLTATAQGAALQQSRSVCQYQHCPEITHFHAKKCPANHGNKSLTPSSILGLFYTASCSVTRDVHKCSFVTTILLVR